MSSMRDKFVNLLIRQIGYKETGTNVTKYARWFDNEAWQYFNTKKQGSEWCSLLQIWAVAQNEILGKAESRKFLGLPAPKNNCAAGVPYLWNYLVAKGYKIDKTKGSKGDIIFFNTKKAKCGHVGSIKKVDSKYYYTIEGNKSNKVGEGKYLKTSSAIYGVCHLPWEKYDKPEPVPTPEPLPDPTPEPKPTPVIPTPKPTKTKYKVTAKSGLRLRKSPNTSSAVLTVIPYGTTITVDKTQNGWAHTTYKGKTGWCSMTYLKKV